MEQIIDKISEANINFIDNTKYLLVVEMKWENNRYVYTIRKRENTVEHGYDTFHKKCPLCRKKDKIRCGVSDNEITLQTFVDKLIQSNLKLFFEFTKRE